LSSLDYELGNGVVEISAGLLKQESQ